MQMEDVIRETIAGMREEAGPRISVFENPVLRHASVQQRYLQNQPPGFHIQRKTVSGNGLVERFFPRRFFSASMVKR